MLTAADGCVESTDKHRGAWAAVAAKSDLAHAG